MWRKLLFSATFLYLVAEHTCFSANVSDFEIHDMDDPKEYLYRELSADAYFNLPCHTKNSTAPTRRQEWDAGAMVDFEHKNSEPALLPLSKFVDKEPYERNQRYKKLASLDPDAKELFNLCYAVSYIWRRGRKSIHKYYHLRDLYARHMPYEIGYITQQIMTKYQNVLELYALATRMEGPENKIGIPHLFFIYKNILEECRNIIHLCNMIHEVTRKYRVVQNGPKSGWVDVPYDPVQKFQERTGNNYTPFRDYERGIEGHEYEKLHHNNPVKMGAIQNVPKLEEQEKQRLHLIQKNYRQYFLDHGEFTMTRTPLTRRTKRWRPKDDMDKVTLDYGWK